MFGAKTPLIIKRSNPSAAMTTRDYSGYVRDPMSPRPPRIAACAPTLSPFIKRITYTPDLPPDSRCAFCQMRLHYGSRGGACAVRGVARLICARDAHAGGAQQRVRLMRRAAMKEQARSSGAFTRGARYDVAACI